MSLFGELRRRNVFRVAAGYVVVGWLIVQVVSALSGPLNLPDWFETVVVVLLGIGLPVALVFAWAFELTPEGVRLTAPGSAPSPAGTNKLDYALIAGLVLVAATSVFADREFARSLGRGAGAPAQSIAVLPFADISPNGDQEYFGDGVAEEILNELTRLEGLQVAGRTASFAFRNTEEFRSIGEALGVATILEGSLRKDGDRIRVTAQLIDAESGYHLWSQVYETELQDIFAIQEDIATSVAGALGVRLGVGDVNAFRGAGTTNVAAYEAYLEALATTPGEDAIPHLRRATALDENYAAAWSLLALRTAGTQFSNPPEQAPEIRDESVRYAARAVELDPGSAQALSIYGTMLYTNRNYIDGEAAHREAISILANRETLFQYGNLLARAGRSSDAIEQFEASREADAPQHRPSNNTWAAYLALGRLEDAREAASHVDDEDTPVRRLSIALNAGDREAIRALLETLASSNDTRSALYAAALEDFAAPESAHERLRAIHENSTVVWPGKGHDIAMLAAWFGDPELALESFAREIRYTSVRQWALWFPHMSEVRQLPGFKELVTEINLVDYWRASGWPDHCRALGPDDFVCG